MSEAPHRHPPGYKRFKTRQEKADSIPDSDIKWCFGEEYLVQSQTERGVWYPVSLGESKHCDCYDYALRGVDCCHLLAAARFKEANVVTGIVQPSGL